MESTPNMKSGEDVLEKQASMVREGDDQGDSSRPTSLHKVTTAGVDPDTFKPSPRLYVAFATLAVITLMVALDGTSLSVALPVSHLLRS